MVKIYIIDDDEITLFLTKMVFEIYSPECECVGFTNGNDALARLKEDVQLATLPDVILLDLNMPLINGFDVLSKLEGLASHWLKTNCRLFMLTSSVDRQDRVNSLKHPLVTDLIEKPFDSDKLRAVLNSTVTP